MTADGPPLVGLGRHDNLFFAPGTDTSGGRWPMGPPRLLADLMEGRRADIDPTPYTPDFSRRHRR